MATNDGHPSKIAGQWHAVKGGLKEGIGRTLNVPNLAREGAAIHDTGRAEITVASAQRAGEGPGTGEGPRKQPSAGGLGGMATPDSTGTTGRPNAIAAWQDYANSEGPRFNSGGPMSTGIAPGGGGGGGGDRPIGSGGRPRDAHLGNDNFISGTRTVQTNAPTNGADPLGSHGGAHTSLGLGRATKEGV